MIPYGCQNISDDEISAVIRVLKSDYLTQGPKVVEFEKVIQNYTGAKYVTAMCNATAALHVGCLALGLTENDYLWTSPISFVASANCGLYCGAKVDFVDIDPLTRNISINELEKKLISAKLGNRLPKVLVVVHFSGVPCDMIAISKLSKEYGFFIIEDAAHGMGSIFNGEPIGKCIFSDLTIFSFHPVKNMTSGEGGVVCTNQADIEKKVKLLICHGITRKNEEFTEKNISAWYYEQQTLGFNYRMTDIHAAIGIVQLDRLNQFVEQRRNLVERYNTLFKGTVVKLPIEPMNAKTAWHIYVIEVPSEEQRDRVMSALLARGIGTSLHYIPIHLQPFYQSFGFRCGDFPAAEDYYHHALTLPLFPKLTNENQNLIVRIVQGAL